MRKIIICLMVAGMAFSANSQEVTSKESRNKIIYNQYKELIETGEFMFTANWVINDKNREKTDAETNNLSFSKNKASGQLNTLNSDNANLKLNEKGVYGVFYSDESELIKIVFTVSNGDSVSNIKLEIKNGKAFLRLDGKGLSDITWIGQLTAL